MALRNALQVMVGFEGDGSTTSLSIDLLRDPYLLPGGRDGAPLNWFGEDGRAKQPVDASATLTSTGVVISSVIVSFPLLTLTFATAPAAGVFDFTDVTLLF